MWFSSACADTGKTTDSSAQSTISRGKNLARIVVRALGLGPMDDKRDLVILGGGLVGMTLALAAAGKGISSHVVDRADPAALTAEGFDGRASAISTARNPDAAGSRWRARRNGPAPIARAASA